MEDAYRDESQGTQEGQDQVVDGALGQGDDMVAGQVPDQAPGDERAPGQVTGQDGDQARAQDEDRAMGQAADQGAGQDPGQAEAQGDGQDPDLGDGQTVEQASDQAGERDAAPVTDEPRGEGARAEAGVEEVEVTVSPLSDAAATYTAPIFLANSASSRKTRDRKRFTEILGVFARHNYYATGLTPHELRTTLEDLGPTYVKIGQILSSRTDILPDVYCQELARLRSEVAPLDASVARAVIEREVGRPIEGIFDEFDDEPLGSASIAQAHRARLKDGRMVVTKVRRPGVKETMLRDFDLLRRLASLVGIINGDDDGEDSLDLVAIVSELERVSKEELDFRVEAAHTREFRERCITDPSVCSCPEVIDELTSERIFTMTYVRGHSIGDRAAIEREGYDRLKIAQALFDNYVHQLLDAGLFHADPHQGNILVSDGVPYWIDFGMVGVADERTVRALRQVVTSFIARDADALATAALMLGEVGADLDEDLFVEDVERIIARYRAVSSLEELDVGRLMEDLIGVMERHKIKMHSNLTTMVRSLVTIEGVMEEFCPELNVIEHLNLEFVRRAQADFDLERELASQLEQLSVSMGRVAKIPDLTAGALDGLVRGRLKMKTEIVGAEEVLDRIHDMVVEITLAAFACVLFAGSCILCTTDITPKSNGMPLIALIGFVFAVSIGIFSVRRMMTHGKKGS